MTLVDPASSPGEAGERIAVEAAKAGTHAIMVGGSTDVTQQNLDSLVRHVKEATQLPVIYFPSSAGAMSLAVDAIYFLSTMNSRNPRFIVGEQMRGAHLVRAAGIEAIGLGYVIVEPGRKVGMVSEADLVQRSDEGNSRAVGYALAAQYFGMPLVYLEAGSGADAPVPPAMIRAVKSAIDVPLVVGGGIREAEHARAALDAGADVLVTGTVAENHHFERLGAIVREVLGRRKGE